MQGRFISFEGIDGCGKTSVAQAVFNQLHAEGRNVILSQEPTKTWLGEAVKRAITEDHTALTEAFLFMADRAAHTNLISDWLSEGRTVLCDRYADSTICYQAVSLALEGFDGDPFDFLKGISDSFFLSPDLTFLLDISPDVALERIRSRDKLTKFETPDFLAKVRENFKRLASVENRIRVVDASQPFQRVVSETGSIIRSLLDTL